MAGRSREFIPSVEDVAGLVDEKLQEQEALRSRLAAAARSFDGICGGLEAPT